MNHDDVVKIGTCADDEDLLCLRCQSTDGTFHSDHGMFCTRCDDVRQCESCGDGPLLPEVEDLCPDCALEHLVECAA